MKKLVIVSGKGGTGKTTIAAAIAVLAGKVVLADCDVDAPNLHLLLSGTRVKQEVFVGSKVALIDAAYCRKCGQCTSVCRFDAVIENKIDQLKCEGCGACAYVCPQQAITLLPRETGQAMLDRTSRGLLAHALLAIGASGSGKLVTKVRQLAENSDPAAELLVIDGSPGIGCVVVASITGCDAALVVTEPTRSGLHDLTRIIAATKHFGVPAYVCINKADLNTTLRREIEHYCAQQQIKIIGQIPFDPAVVKCQQALKPVVFAADSLAGQAIHAVWREIQKVIGGNQDADCNCGGR